MTRYPFVELLLGAASILLAAHLWLTFTVPGKAADPACKTIEDLEADTEAAGGTIAGAAYYNGQTTDTLIVIETVDSILLVGFKGGCYVTYIALEPRAEETPA